MTTKISAKIVSVFLGVFLEKGTPVVAVDFEVPQGTSGSNPVEVERRVSAALASIFPAHDNFVRITRGRVVITLLP